MLTTGDWIKRGGETASCLAQAEGKEDLHDDARARSLLESATAETSDLLTLTRLAVAWGSMFRDEWVSGRGARALALGPGSGHITCAARVRVHRAWARRDSAWQYALRLSHGVLAPLLESAWTLGLDDELELFLVWLVEVMAWEERPWTLFALVLSLARRAPGDPRPGPLVAELAALETSDEELPTLMLANRSVGYGDLWRARAAEVLDPARGVPLHLERLALQSVRMIAP